MRLLLLFVLTVALVAAGDTAVALLKAGAQTDKKDVDGFLALDLAPGKEVRSRRMKFCSHD